MKRKQRALNTSNTTIKLRFVHNGKFVIALLKLINLYTPYSIRGNCWSRRLVFNFMDDISSSQQKETRKRSHSSQMTFCKTFWPRADLVLISKTKVSVSLEIWQCQTEIWSCRNFRRIKRVKVKRVREEAIERCVFGSALGVTVPPAAEFCRQRHCLTHISPDNGQWTIPSPNTP